MDRTPLYRPLTAADIPSAQRLRQQAHWNQSDEDWRHLIEMDPEGCFAAELDGRIVGTATAARFEPASGPGSFGWVGMVLVDEACRGKGLGSALLTRAIDYLRNCDVETVKLDATPMGRPVYLKQGFRDECMLERWKGIPALNAADAPPCPGIRLAPVNSHDLNYLVGFDAHAFGAQRRQILASWMHAWPERSIGAWNGSRLVGYALARRRANWPQIGPVVCETPEIGIALLARAFELAAGREVVLDLFSENKWSIELAQRAGLTQQRTLTRMYHGPNASPGHREQLAAIAGPEVG
ncbi:MAG TPA: GNAT family N-acetyltransferase [Planctomycetota bacterium]|jgi:GNAT superfamily N-acetyltransferase